MFEFNLRFNLKFIHNNPIGTRGSLSLGVKWPGREADHSRLSSAEVKACLELYLHSPVCLTGAVPS